MTQIKVELLSTPEACTDLDTVNAARVSFDKESELEFSCEQGDPTTGEWVLSEADTKLIKYLASHRHMTPFRHNFIKLRCKAPVFLVRQLMKHQAGLSWNEVSRRYVSDRPEFYIPEVWRGKPEGSIKQGSAGQVIIDGVKVCKSCGKNLEFIRKEDETMKEFCHTNCQAHYYRKHTPKGWAARKAATLKQSAKKRDIEFSVDTDYIMSLGTPSHCPYLGIKLGYDNNELKDNSPSINRIDPSKGYVTGNLEIVSNKANTMLLTATSEELKTFTRNIAMKRHGIFMDTADSVESFYEKCADAYELMIAEGVAPELARSILPISHMTEWIWSGNLLAFAHVYNERIAAGAQQEAQEFAKQLNEAIGHLAPVSWEALTCR